MNKKITKRKRIFHQKCFIILRIKIREYLYIFLEEKIKNLKKKKINYKYI
jgi:hypothetical protein